MRDQIRRDKRPDDQAGHLISRKFGGVANQDNIVPQHKNLNQGDYRKAENKVAREMEKLNVNDHFQWRNDLKYDPGNKSKRPDEIHLKVKTSDGKEIVDRKFDNRQG